MNSHDSDPSRTTAHDYAVILLAGGRASRLPGKLARRSAQGRTLLATSLSAILALTPESPRRVVIAGPVPQDMSDPAYADPRVHLSADREPFAGPARAVAAAIEAVDEPITVVLAGDAPRGALAVSALLAAIRAGDPSVEGPEAAVLVTDQRQHLCSAYLTDALRRTSVGAIRAADLSAGLRVTEVGDAWGAADDIDTVDDARSLGFDHSEGT